MSIQSVPITLFLQKQQKNKIERNQKQTHINQTYNETIQINIKTFFLICFRFVLQFQV